MKVFKIIIRVVIFVLLLVLAINNMQVVEFNFLGIYTLKLPLIITLAIFGLGGLFIGSIIGLVNNLALKTQIGKLKKQVTKQSITQHDQII